MAQSSTNINLISTKTERPEQLVTVTDHLRRVGLGALILSLALGLFFGVGVVVLRLRTDALTEERDYLVTRIKRASRKETIYTVLAKQSAVAAKVLSSVEPWERVVDQVTTVAPGTTLSSAATNEKRELTITANVSSVEEGAAVVERISRLTNQKLIRNAVLESFEVGKEGKVKLVITFAPNL